MSGPSGDLLRTVTAEAVTGELSPAQAGELLGLLAKGLRAHQMYQPNNPVYQRFMEGLRAAFARCWEQASSLRFTVGEATFHYGDASFAIGEGRDSLAFFFYKDGIRHLTFHPGFEDEIVEFLDIVHRAKHIGLEGDDLVTLLWEHEFESFEYSYVDVLAEGVEVPEGPKVDLPVISADIITDLKAEGVGTPTSAGMGTGAAAPEAPEVIRRSDFKETLYFLDPAELEALQTELEREWSRDVKDSVLAALFDRLEDGTPARQTEILSILRQLLPVYIARGDLNSAATILRELEELLRTGKVFAPEQRTEVMGLFNELSSPVVLGQLVQVLEAGTIQRNSQDLGPFLAHLRPTALSPLIRAAEVAQSNMVRLRLEPAIDRLAARHPDEVARCLQSKDEAVAIGAARLVGRVRLTELGDLLASFLERPSEVARMAAVESLIALRSSTAISALQTVLEDPVREIRIAAIRGLGSLRYQPARKRFEELVKGRAVKTADLTEKLAIFEAYAAIGGADAVPLLDRLLNEKGGLLGRRQPTEIRACAATALGHIATPSARAALEAASTETDPVVKSAVVRALRRESNTT